jgi:hypothetical protein
VAGGAVFKDFCHEAGFLWADFTDLPKFVKHQPNILAIFGVICKFLAVEDAGN